MLEPLIANSCGHRLDKQAWSEQWADQVGLDGPLMLNATQTIRLLLLIYWPIPEGHACCRVVTHLFCMVGAPLARPAAATGFISRDINAQA